MNQTRCDKIQSMSIYEPGDYVKVEFKDESDPIGEWMWVRVESCDDARRLLFGTLDNAPVMDYGDKLELGSRLAISYDKIREHRKAAEFGRQ
jgi:hypothetical protein